MTTTLTQNEPLDPDDRERHAQSLRSMLAAIMLADQKVHDTEVKAIVRAITKLNSEIGSEHVSATAWLKDNIEEINEALQGPNRLRWLSLQFLKLRDFPDKKFILDNLWRIAVADGELHPSESEILDQATWLWNRDNL